MSYEEDTRLCTDVETDDCGDELSSYGVGHAVKLKVAPKQVGEPDVSDDGYKSYGSLCSTDSLTQGVRGITLKDSISSVDEGRKLHQEVLRLNAINSNQSVLKLKSIDEGYGDSYDSSTADRCPSTELKNDNFDHFEKIEPSVALLSESDPCRCDDDDVAETVFEIYLQDEDGDTKLHLAIIHKMVDIAEEFISLAPDHNWLDIPNCLLQTPLHISVITKQHHISRRLIVGGACVTLQDTKGFTPLHIACMQNDIESVRLLLTPVKYEEQKINHYQIPYQKIPQNLEIKNYEGHTCLHLAALNTNLEMMKLLLEKGANINCQDGKSGRTCLHYAAETNNLKLFQFLLNQAGLNVNALTYGSQTAMALAEGHKFYNIVKVLHEHGGSMMLEEDSSDSDSDPDMIEDSLISNFMCSEHFVS